MNWMRNLKGSLQISSVQNIQDILFNELDELDEEFEGLTSDI